MTTPLLLPQIPVDEAELRAALESAAIPGFNGSLTVMIGLRRMPSMTELDAGFIGLSNTKTFLIIMAVTRRETLRPGKAGPQTQMLPDPERKKAVQDVIEQLRPKLFIRPILQCLEVQYDNGRVMKLNIAE